MKPQLPAEVPLKAPKKPRSNTISKKTMSNTMSNTILNTILNPSMNQSFKMTEKQLCIFKNALARCGDCVDLNGWRYNKELGFEEYIEIDPDNVQHSYQFYVSVKFLRTHFPIKGKDETISSAHLRNSAEQWWKETTEENIDIDNGIMLVAIVACGLAPRDLWHSMDVTQKAIIGLQTWQRFCKKFHYKI